MPLSGDGGSGTFSAAVTSYGGYKIPPAPASTPAVGASRLVSQPSPGPTWINDPNTLSLADSTTATSANTAAPDNLVPSIGAPGTFLFRTSGPSVGKHWEFAGTGSARGGRAASTATMVTVAQFDTTGLTLDGDTGIIRHFAAAQTGGGMSINIRADGTMAVVSHTAANLAITGVVPLGPLRVQFATMIGTGTTDGTVRAEFYWGSNVSGTVPDFSYSATNVNAGTAPYTDQRLGKLTGSGPTYPIRLLWAQGSTLQADFAGFTPIIVAMPATASGSITLGGSADTQAVAASSGSITLGGTTAAAAPVSSTGSITLGGSSTATAAASASGSITLGGTATAQARATSAGTITLAGAATASSPASATGTVTLSGTSTATAPVTASGTVTLGGTAAATAAATAAGTITLSGTATSGAAPVAATATGSITLGGSAAAQAPATAGGTITLGGAATVAVPATTAGLITLSGLATATALEYLTHIYGTAVVVNNAGTAVLAGDGTSTAILDAEVYATAALAAGTLGAAVLAPVTAATAVLTSDGTSTAVLTSTPGTAVIQLT